MFTFTNSYQNVIVNVSIRAGSVWIWILSMLLRCVWVEVEQHTDGRYRGNPYAYIGDLTLLGSVQADAITHSTECVLVKGSVKLNRVGEIVTELYHHVRRGVSTPRARVHHFSSETRPTDVLPGRRGGDGAVP